MTSAKLEPILANVVQVTVKGDKVLVPLVPLTDAGTEIDAAIVYDLVRLGFAASHPFMKDRPLVRAGNSVKKIVEYVRSRGYRVIQRNERNEDGSYNAWGWGRTSVDLDAPIPTIGEAK